MYKSMYFSTTKKGGVYSPPASMSVSALKWNTIQWFSCTVVDSERLIYNSSFRFSRIVGRFLSRLIRSVFHDEIIIGTIKLTQLQ